MSKQRPEAESIVEQLLLSYKSTGKHHVLRRRRVGSGGVAMLRAAGLSGERAKAINTMARRTADAWRKGGHDPGPAELDSEVDRLLT